MNKLLRSTSILLAAVGITSMGIAQNPIVQTSYTPDPAPMVYNNTVYLYSGQDEPGDY